MEKKTALKILRELHNKVLFSERTALETFVPELKESEDDRIKENTIKNFIKNNDIEYRWQDIYNANKVVTRNLTLWIPADNLIEFCELLGYSAFDDGSYLITTLCYDGYTFVENFDEVLEKFGIDAKQLFPDTEI